MLSIMTSLLGHRQTLASKKEDCGLKASPTQVFRSFTPPQKGKGVMVEGSVTEKATFVISELKDKYVI